jgi:GTP-binding nuclear protein Ran
MQSTKAPEGKSVRSFKIMVDGMAGVGKTSFIKRHKTGEFSKEYLPTMGVDVTPLAFNTTSGEIVFKVWDLSGNSALRGDDDAEGYYKGAQGLLAFYEVNVPSTFNRAYALAKKHIGLATAICGNKADTWTEHKLQVSEFTTFGMSVKSAHQYDRPFLHLARALTGNKDLQFIEWQPSNPHKLAPTTRSVIEVSVAPSLYVLPHTPGTFRACMQALTKLPKQIDIEKTGMNRVRVTGTGRNTDSPELFEVAQIKDGSYEYYHFENGTQKVIGHLTRVDPSNFTFPHKCYTACIELFSGDTRVDLLSHLVEGSAHLEQNYAYFLSAEDGYDGFGEPLRDDLEDVLCDMGASGYNAVIQVAVKYYRQ